MQQKKITVSKIPKAGITVQLNKNEPWLIDVFRNLVRDHKLDEDTINGTTQIMNYDGNVELNGKIGFVHYPLCDKCGNSFTRNENITIHNYISPVFSENDHDEGDDSQEIELDFDDLDFTGYSHDIFYLDEIINDSIAMELPYSYRCKEDCKGLCHICGINKNEESCDCEKNQIDPRWQALKDIKIKKN